MSVSFAIAETNSFSEKLKGPKFKKIKTKLHDYIYPILKRNPFFGPNIKRLKGKFSSYYRYRIGDYRLFYKIDQKEIIVFIIDIEHRKDSYK